MGKRLFSFVVRMVRTAAEKQVPRAAAQISYYLLFSIFPLLLVLVACVGFFRLDVAEVMNVLTRISPVAEDLLGGYIAYIVENESPGLMAAGIAMAITASSAAFRGLMRITGEMAGRPTFRGLSMMGVSIVMSLVLLFTIFAFLLATVTGRWFLEVLTQKLHITAVAWMWQWLRFPIVFTLGVLAITALYRVCLSKKALPNSKAWPGAVIASVSLVVGTGLFSAFLSMSTRYSLVYGSLANIMLLMLYLFVCSNILVAGNLINCLRARSF